MMKFFSAAARPNRIHSSRKANSRNANAHGWSFAPLESRVMLAADCGQAVEVASDINAATVADSIATDASTIVASAADETSQIVFVDVNLDDVDRLLGGLDANSEVVLIDGNSNGIEQITRVLATRSNVQSIHLIAHGEAGRIQLGNQCLDQATLDRFQQEIRSWAVALTANADILIYGCETGAGDLGLRLMQRLSVLTGADVAGSTNRTGRPGQDADWDLERHVGVIETDLAIDIVTQNSYQATLPITIRAAGSRGEEQMALQIDGVIVQTWNNVGGDADARNFLTFTYAVDGVSADRIRVVFTNDVYDPANGIDRNLRVDSITVDGTTFETEAPDVYSTGTWLPADGITPGFRQSEFLHANGYLQFAANSGSGSSILIRAQGATGQETMELQIDGSTVQTWQNISGGLSSYAYQAAGNVTADQVRVVFTNDLYDPANGIDRNLRVDNIVVDGTTYETEASNVFSTGTWRPADGITPGFRNSEWLHGNGYFQYESAPTTQPGSISLTIENVTVDEDTGQLSVVVIRTGGTDGPVSVNYTTNNGSANTGDYQPISGTLTFADGVSDQQLDINILNDSADEPNESFTLTLSNPTGGATLGPITTQTITIRDDDDLVTGVIFQDSFEGVSNWTTNPFGTDTATAGMWEVGSPEQTSSSGTTIQFGSGRTGPRALVTGLAAGGSVGTYDIDSGVTSVRSSQIALPTASEIELSLSYNFAHTANSSNSDFFRVSIYSGGTQTVLAEDRGNNVVRPANWIDRTFDLSPFAGQTIQILIEAADAGSGSLVEASVDDVVVEVIPNLPGTLDIATANVNVDESTGTADVTIVRNNGRTGAVSINYTTVNGSATTGDYVATSGTLIFADGQSQQTISIPIIDDATDEDLEQFTLVISNPTGGAILGPQTVATITIADDDSTVADYLPDLTPIASTLSEQLSIDTGEIPGRKLLRFSTEVANAGDGPLELWGGATSTNTQEVFQRIYQVDGGSRDRLAGDFVLHPQHGHIHFEGLATYTLTPVSGGGVVASGGKTSFCLVNIRQPFPGVTANAGRVHGRGGNSCGQIQGISTGYSDVYSASLPDQWIDITNVANGSYWLEIEADPFDQIVEVDETNNSARIRITIQNGSVSAG